MLFKDLIEHKNVSELKNFCRWSGLTNFTQVSQINMEETISKIILSKNGLQELIYLLPKCTYELIEEVSNKKVHLGKANFIAYLSGERALLLTKDADGSIVMPSDVLALFKEINTKELKNEYKIKHHVVSAIKFADAFYGYYSIKELDKLIALNSYAAKAPEGIAYYQNIVGSDMTDEDIFTNLSEAEVDELKKVQADKPYYIPTLKELEEFYTFGYIETPELKRFLNVVAKAINSEESRYFLAFQLQGYLNTRNVRPGSYLTGLIAKFKPLQTLDQKYLAMLYVAAINSMPVIANRGNSADAIKKLEKTNK